MSGKRAAWLAAGILALLAVLVVIVVALTAVLPKLATVLSRPFSTPEAGHTGQTVLPFGSLSLATASNGANVAVDRAGNVYVADARNGRILKLAVGAAEPTLVPISGLGTPNGVAVDPSGTVYGIQSDYHGTRLAKLSAGASSAVDLPASKVVNAQMAVDASGAVYVAGLTSVARLAPNADHFDELPLPRGFPRSVAVDAAGAVYVLVMDEASTNENRVYRVQKLTAGSYTDVTPAGLRSKGMNSLALDARGAIYLTEVGQVSKLPPGAGAAVNVAFSDLMDPRGIAIGPDGSVYVTDITGGGGRVLRLAP
jgi:serine/threonine protein kinase, bacterial